MRRKHSSTVFKLAFLLTIVIGSFLNLFQVLKLRDPTTTGRRNEIENAGLDGTVRIKQHVFVNLHGKSEATTKNSTSDATRINLVKPDDFVYSAAWDASPIVVESHKLVFFTVPKAGCTIWKQLFRRMMGHKNWQKQSKDSDYKQVPHNPKFNGLTYLHDYSLEDANHIMTSPEYTRAIFVRDPKERFLSAFLDKAMSNGGAHVQNKCCPSGDCMKEAQTFPGFVNLVFKKGCKNPHWNSQSRRMEPKYWKYIDFVGHVETASSDAKQLLQKVGAWEEFGESGWGTKNDKAVFESSEDAVSHATWAKWRMWQYYTPELETIVENFYSADYANPRLKLLLNKLY